MAASLFVTGCGSTKTTTAKKSAPKNTTKQTQQIGKNQPSFDLSSIPAFTNKPYVVLNGNVPDFPDADKKSKKAFEHYSNLDSLGRCGPAYANVCLETMPTQKRGPIGQVKPSGWQTVKYEGIDGKYLYNRCHLIGYQLTAENANPKNLITGADLNVTGMLPFENLVADYVKETKHHVLYRVTPIFKREMTWWPEACRWKPTAWKMPASSSTCSCTTTSPVSPSITKTGKSKGRRKREL